jgi:hypothetical protein
MKERINAIAENQINLFSKLSGFATEAAQIIMPETGLLNNAKTIAEEYSAKSRELAESFFSAKSNEKIWETWPHVFVNVVELNMDVYHKAVNFYRNTAEKYNSKTNEEKWSSLNRIYKESFEAVVKTAESNFKTLYGLN